MPLPKTENGWASLNGNTTGGTGGSDLTFSSWVEMRSWLTNDDNLTTPAKLLYTGSDIDFTGQPQSVWRFEKIGLSNKTIRASGGQKITLGNIRFRDNHNIIWENWKHFDSLDDIIGVQSDSTNIWVRHCELDANSFNTSFRPVDGNFDVSLRSDFCAITDCLIKNGDKTCLVSSSNDSTDDRGKMRITYRRNKFQDCIQRIPFVRFGKIGLEYNIVDTVVEPFLTGGSKIVQVGLESQIFTYRNDFIRGRWLFSDEGSGGVGGVKSVENRIGTFDSNTSEINPSYVTWSPLTEEGYTLEDWTIDEATDWVNAWSGANMHLMFDDEDPDPPTIPPFEQGNRRFFARRNPIV
jgi:pectate lyase